MEGAELRSGSSQPRGLWGMRRLRTAKESPLRTFQRLAPPARVEDETELGGSAAFVPRADQRSGVCLYVCLYMWGCESVVKPPSASAKDLRSQASGQVCVC